MLLHQRAPFWYSTHLSPPQGTLTEGDVAEAEGWHIEVKGRPDDTAPAGKKAGRGGAGVVKEEGKVLSSIALHPCTQRGTQVGRHQPKQGHQKLLWLRAPGQVHSQVSACQMKDLK